MTWRLLAMAPSLLLLACASAPPVSENDRRAADANTQLALHHLLQGDLVRSSTLVDRALAQDPGQAMAFAVRGLLQERLGDARSAETDFRKALELSSERNQGAIQNMYGTFLCRQGHLDRADAAFVSAGSDPLYETPEMAWTNAGVCALERPDPELAARHLRRALQDRPGHEPAIRELDRLNAGKAPPSSGAPLMEVEAHE